MHARVRHVADWRKGFGTPRVEDVLPRHLSPDLLYENPLSDQPVGALFVLSSVVEPID